MKRSLFAFAAALLALPLAAAPMKVHGWNTWPRKGEGGKFERVKPSADFPQGALKFLPDPGKKRYSLHAYGFDPAKPDQKKKYTVKLACSADLNPGVTIVFSLKAKSASGSWYNLFTKPVSTSLDAVPGSETQMTLEVDLKPLKAEKLGGLVPYIVVNNLTRGSVALCGAEVETETSTWAPPPRPAGPGLPGFTRRDDALREFSWPAPIPLAKFARMIRFTAIGLNIIELAPAQKGAAFQWPDGRTVAASWRGGKWVVEAGIAPALKEAASFPGEKLAAAFDGTGVTFRTADGKLHRVEGGFEAADAALLMPEGVATPKIKSLYIADNALLWCFADEAEQRLELAAGIFTRQLPVIREAWGRGSQERSWNGKLNFYRRSLAKVKDQAVAATDGFLPALVADPILRDRYNWLVWMAGNAFENEGGYFGGEFRKIWFAKLGGRGEIYSALLFAEKLGKLVARSRRVTGAAFKEGVAWENRLAAGFVSPLERVPRRAGLPVDLRRSAELRAARGEAESLQLVLTAARNAVGKVSLRVVPETPGAPPVRMERIGYIPLMETANPQLPLSPGGETAEPDVCLPLAEGETFAVGGYCNQPVLLTAQCAADAKPGEYRYTVTVSAEGKEAAKLPFSLKVEPFALGKRFPNIAGGPRASTIAAWYGAENAQQARRNMSKTMMLYRLEPLDLYVFSPHADDWEWGLANGVQAINLGQFNGMAHPEPGMTKFIELYGSADGKSFVRVPAEAKLVQRDPKDPLSDQDLVITPKSSMKKYRFCKVHYAETRGWYDRVVFSFFELYPSLGAAVEVNGSEPVREIRVIQPDKDPAANGMAQAKKAESIRFDSLRSGSNLASVLWEKNENEITSIRLINRRIEIVLRGLKAKYDAVRAKAGKDVALYMFGFDEVGSHLNGRVLSALKNAQRAFPDVKLISTVANAAALPEIYDHLDFQCPANAYALPRYESNIAATRHAKFWTYVGGGGYYPFCNFERVDQPRINSRAFFWEPIAFDHIEGFLYWDIHMWRNNKHLLDRKDDIDWSLWNPNHGDNNGMGALFYPGKGDTVYPSLRASAIRDGIEDVELFRLARNKVKREEDRAELEAIRRGFARSMSVYCKDIAEMEKLRGRLFDLLEKGSGR